MSSTVLERYIAERVLPLASEHEPVPFRGLIDGSSEPLPFVDELEADLRGREGAIWSITGPPGTGKTLLARWLAARWGRRFLDDPGKAPAVLWLDPPRVATLPSGDNALPGDLPLILALAGVPAGELAEAAAALRGRSYIVILDKDDDPELADWCWSPGPPRGLLGPLRILHWISIYPTRNWRRPPASR
jgi:hypothetical protein